MKSEPVTMPVSQPSSDLSHAASSDRLYHHGGNLAAARLAFPNAPEPWIDLSTGINPIAYPVPEVSAASWARLPEENAVHRLERIAASAYGLYPDAETVAAPGTQVLIELLPRIFAAKRVGILGFTYAEHAKCWQRAGAEVTTVASLAELRGFDVAIVVNPNNPDGRLISATELRSLSEAMAEAGRRLIVDEAFIDVMYQGSSLAPYLTAKGTIILRSFGKTYGLAGLRLGFALAGHEDAALIRQALGLWAISGPAIAIGSKALDDRAWLDETRDRLISDAAKLDVLIHKMGMSVVGGTPLYRLAQSDDAAVLFQRLAEAGILVRAFRDKPHWLRFGLPGGGAEWMMLADRLRGI